MQLANTFFSQSMSLIMNNSVKLLLLFWKKDQAI